MSDDTSEPVEVVSSEETTKPTPSFDRRAWVIVTLISILVIASNVGTILSAKLVNSHPAVLIALDSRLRHLLLAAATDITVIAFFSIAFFRLVIADPIFYLAGRWYGDAGLRWLETQSGRPNRTIRWIERWFPKASYFLVALMPNNLVCLLAGQTRMRPSIFVVLNVGGTIIRLVLIWLLAEAFEAQFDAALSFISRFQWPLTALLFAVVMIQSARKPKEQDSRATAAKDS